MLEIGPQHPIEYRQEILEPFFRYVQSAESFYVVGAASMGKTRLLDFLTRPEVQKYYLGEHADQHWLIRVDLNRLAVKKEDWGFYELLLSSVLLDLNNHENIDKQLYTEIAKLDADIIQNRDLLLALRFFELVANKLCQVHHIKLCFLFDEFDEAYKSFPRETFLQLRAVRDANKNRVAFVLFLRDLPERLRAPNDNESFYELLSRNRLGLRPYTRQDALRIIQQIETRREYSLDPEQRGKLFEASGGHPGLIQAILSTLIETPHAFQKFDAPGWLEWLSRQPAPMEECRKIWNLSTEEQEALCAFAAGDVGKISIPVGDLLFAKGLLRRTDKDVQFFSGIFERYVKSVPK